MSQDEIDALTSFWCEFPAWRPHSLALIWTDLDDTAAVTKWLGVSKDGHKYAAAVVRDTFVELCTLWGGRGNRVTWSCPIPIMINIARSIEQARGAA